jgi:hypothetical protein
METLTISWRPSGLSRPFGNPQPTLCGLDAHHGIRQWRRANDTAITDIMKVVKLWIAMASTCQCHDIQLAISYRLKIKPLANPQKIRKELKGIEITGAYL